MDLNQKPPEIIMHVRKCRHMGLKEDNQTWSSTDQLQNFCHAGKRPELVEWDHQCEYCFSETYGNCPLLAVKRKTNPLPTISAPRHVGAAILLALFITVSIIIFWFGFPPLFVAAEATTIETPPSVLPQTAGNDLPRMAQPSSTATAMGGSVLLLKSTPLQAASATATPAITSSPTAVITSATPSATALATSTATPGTPTSGPSLETPFGMQRMFLVHQVSSGEYWERLASTYNTTKEVLLALNSMDSQDTLYVEKLIVILPGVKDVGNVQPRQAIYLFQETDVNVLAEKYKVSVERLRSENGLGSAPTIPGWRWLVVPFTP